MTINDILRGLPVEQLTVSQSAALDAEVAGVTQDSRLVKSGFVFVAIAGTAQDGHDYLAQALKQGAVAVVHSKEFAGEAGVKIRVEDARKTLARLAARFYGDPSRSMRVVGITGTNGKTTTSYLVESILKADGRSVGVLGTVNYRYAGVRFPAENTTPESVDVQRMLAAMKAAGVTDVVMEVSSHALTMERVAAVDFDVAAFTNLTQDHLDYHASLEAYFNAKKTLFHTFLPQGSKKKYAVLNTASDWSRRIDVPSSVTTVSVGGEGSDIACESVRMDAAGMTMTLKAKGEGRPVEVQSPLLGRFNLENILVAIGVARALGVPWESVKNGIRRSPQIPGRLERIENARGVHVFVDFAHTPDALARVGEELRRLASRRIITVFGCGGDRDRTKRPLMAAEAEKFSDVVIVTSDNPRTEDPEAILDDVMKGFRENKALRVADRREALRQAVGLARKDDMILVAGKGHEDYQIVGKTKNHFSDQEVLKEFLKEAA